MDEKMSASNIGGKTAGYLFEFKHDGVYLTVYPNEDDEIQFELSDMRQILRDYKADDYDIELLAKTVREASGIPVKLANEFTVPAEGTGEVQNVSVESRLEDEHKNYGKCSVEVSADRLEARVRFEIGEGQAVPSVEMIMEELHKKNVSFGIDDAAIREASKDGRPFIAARGIPQKNGEDAKIIRRFALGEKGKPVLNEYDQADYKNLNLFQIAKKGQILAERIPHTHGTPGTSIYGDPISAKNGKPRPLPVGKNTVVQDDNFLVADIDGQIVDTPKKISVDPHLDIRGDVGVGTGNIDFIGGVTIGGNVEQGFVVKATGDIEINGLISGAVVEGRNILVKGGIQGMNRGHVKAEENIICTFAENADLEAGVDVYIRDVAMHSTVRAGKVLHMDEGKGQITGGMMAAGEEIIANIIGNTANVVTRLTVGVNPLLQKRYQTVLKEYMEAKKKLDQLNKTLNTLGKIDVAQLPKEKQDMINSLVRSQFPLAGLVERCEKELKEIDAEMQKMKKGKIKVCDTMYPGVKLSINSIMKNVQTEEKHCCQYVEEEYIRTGPL